MSIYKYSSQANIAILFKWLEKDEKVQLKNIKKFLKGLDFDVIID
jgi:hypothetical protein